MTFSYHINDSVGIGSLIVVIHLALPTFVAPSFVEQLVYLPRALAQYSIFFLPTDWAVHAGHFRSRRQEASYLSRFFVSL